MCKITNKFAEELLIDLRKLDKKEEVQKPELLAKIKFMQETLEEYETILKNDLKETLKETVYVSELGKKVLLSEGRKSSEYETELIAGLLPPSTFLKIVSITKKKVDELNDNKVTEIVKRHTIENFGAPFITVIKMNKQELIEHKK